MSAIKVESATHLRRLMFARRVKIGFVEAGAPYAVKVSQATALGFYTEVMAVGSALAADVAWVPEEGISEVVLCVDGGMA